MGNFLFRTGSYRRAKAIEGEQKKTNALLAQIARQQTATQPPASTFVAANGYTYTADGRYWWDGSAWRPVTG